MGSEGWERPTPNPFPTDGPAGPRRRPWNTLEAENGGEGPEDLAKALSDTLSGSGHERGGCGWGGFRQKGEGEKASTALQAPQDGFRTAS